MVSVQDEDLALAKVLQEQEQMFLRLRYATPAQRHKIM